MKNILRQILPFVGSIFLAYSCVVDDVTKEKMSITGKVIDVRNAPIEGAEIVAKTLDEEFSTKTDADGAYSFSDVPHGVYLITATNGNQYVAETKSFVVAQGAPVTETNFTLHMLDEDFYFEVLSGGIPGEVDASGASISVEIETNVDFVAETTDSWIIVDSQIERIEGVNGGKDKSILKIRFEPNGTGGSRFGVVRLKPQFFAEISYIITQLPL